MKNLVHLKFLCSAGGIYREKSLIYFGCLEARSNACAGIVFGIG